MSVEILDGATIINFIEDEAAFTISVSERFAYLDTDHDGILSYAEMLRELQSLRVFEIHFGNDVKPEPDELARVYTSLFLQFDHDCNGAVDLEEYKAETKNMMLAMANGMGFLPVQMVLEQNSLLKKAVERESTKVAAWLHRWSKLLAVFSLYYFNFFQMISDFVFPVQFSILINRICKQEDKSIQSFLLNLKVKKLLFLCFAFNSAMRLLKSTSKETQKGLPKWASLGYYT